uniref:Glutathione S-transferase n=1 Tax=Spumella elongata TaxID=89044 RepID=A0A7S3H7U5_9STRA
MTDLSHPSNIRLVYFDIPAKAEPVRLAFHVGGVKFTDERVNGAQWQGMKVEYGQYAQIPLLEVDGRRIYQTVNLILYAALITGLNATNLEDELRLREIILACDDIPNTFSGTFSISNAEERIVARTVLFKPGGRTYCQMKRIEELVGDREYLIGDKLTVADLTVFTNCCMLRCGHFEGFPRDCLDGYPKLKTFVERISSHPKVLEYYSTHTSAWAAGFRPQFS